MRVNEYRAGCRNWSGYLAPGCLALVLFVSGCLSPKYYQVTDDANGRTFYTPKVTENKKAGSVTFVDVVSGRQVTVQKARITKIDRARFNEETLKQGAGRAKP